jgi:glycosyltransferase involved in cell wall biosynthesis
VLLVGYGLPFHQHAFFQAWRSGYPLLFRGETTDHAQNRSCFKSSLRTRVLRWFYARCARLLYVGQRSRDHYLRLDCPPEKLVFSPYCVSTEPFECGETARQQLRSAARETLGIRPESRVLLFSGKLSARKGPDLLLQAVKHLPRSHRDQMVVLYLGDGELRMDLEALAHCDPSVDVRFLGFQNQRQISRYFHAADLLVLPSVHSETWGLVVNEALHHGLPAVVSEGVGSGPDLIEPGVTGEICEVGSTTSLAASLVRGLSLAGREEGRAACRSKIACYTVDKAAEGLAAAFEAVATSRRAAGSGA